MTMPVVSDYVSQTRPLQGAGGAASAESDIVACPL